MADWFRMHQYRSLSHEKWWSFGYETCTGCSDHLYYWLQLRDDEDWSFLGEENLHAMLSTQKNQLRAVEDARCVVERRMEDVAEVDRAFSAITESLYAASESIKHIDCLSMYTNPLDGVFRGGRLKKAIWDNWDRKERDARIDRVYSDYSGNFQDVLECYTGIVEEVKRAIAKLEEVCSTSLDNGYETPPVLPWLRMDGHFKKGDKILGWKKSHSTQHKPNLHGIWNPCLDKVLGASNGMVYPLSGFLDVQYHVESPNIMLVEEAEYYHENDSYRRLLLEKLKRPDYDYFYEILDALGEKDVFDSMVL